jgi:hypothetical protein
MYPILVLIEQHNMFHRKFDPHGLSVHQFNWRITNFGFDLNIADLDDKQELPTDGNEFSLNFGDNRIAEGGF